MVFNKLKSQLKVLKQLIDELFNNNENADHPPHNQTNTKDKAITYILFEGKPKR